MQCDLAEAIQSLPMAVDRLEVDAQGYPGSLLHMAVAGVREHRDRHRDIAKVAKG